MKALLDSDPESGWSPGHIPGDTRTIVVTGPDEDEQDELVIVEAPVPGTVEGPLAGRATHHISCPCGPLDGGGLPGAGPGDAP